MANLRNYFDGFRLNCVLAVCSESARLMVHRFGKWHTNVDLSDIYNFYLKHFSIGECLMKYKGTFYGRAQYDICNVISSVIVAFYMQYMAVKVSEVFKVTKKAFLKCMYICYSSGERLSPVVSSGAKCSTVCL